jgi:hypothetical protein
MTKIKEKGYQIMELNQIKDILVKNCSGKFILYEMLSCPFCKSIVIQISAYLSIDKFIP